MQKNKEKLIEKLIYKHSMILFILKKPHPHEKIFFYDVPFVSYFSRLM